MNIIEIQRLTKDYGNHRGVFNITLSIKKGEVYGYLGPNGAGKSTTMRHLMGFSKAQSGQVLIKGLDCWKEQKIIQQSLGYLPGEITFPDDMVGLAYLRLIGRMRKMQDFSYAEKLLNRFELDPDTEFKRMSKGMKQKIGIVAAFMHDPEILLLDEPTSGLDPLMQNRFIELIEEEKRRGKTILLSSHIFEEMEKTCDRVGMIRNGELIKQVTIDELRHSQFKSYSIKFAEESGAGKIKQLYPESNRRGNQVLVSIRDSEINSLLSALSQCDILSLEEKKHSLEEYFMQFYDGGNEDD